VAGLAKKSIKLKDVLIQEIAKTCIAQQQASGQQEITLRHLEIAHLLCRLVNTLDGEKKETLGDFKDPCTMAGAHLFVHIRKS
jgi:hypothetical protein